MWTDIVQAIASVGSLTIAVIGFAFVIVQIRQLKNAIQSDTHSKLYSEDFEWVKILLEYPQLRPYFYDDQDITSDHQDYSRVLGIAELICTHFEHAVLQMENLPTHIVPRWHQYIRSLYNRSPIVRRHLKENEGWYSDRLMSILSQT